MQLKFKRLNIDAKLPVFSTEGAACMDLYACLPDKVVIGPGQSLAIPTGIAIELPNPNFEAQIRGRSGLAFKERVIAFNGTIDADYRGEINVLLFNLSSQPYEVKPNDRIAQMSVQIISGAQSWEPVFVDDLSDTKRGTNGFGSTGT